MLIAGRSITSAQSIMTHDDLKSPLTALKKRAARLPNVQMNLAIVRLACCCGLRASEIGGLRLGDVRLGIARPHLVIRAECAKLGRPRRVPLWWDAGTFANVVAWAAERTYRGAKPEDALICSAQTNRRGEALKRHALRRRFRTACNVLGPQRVYDLTIHHGRHTFISHALAGGRTLAEVRDAAGHSNVSITSAYLHVAVDEDGKLGDLFKFD
jgi:integrase